jgi:hypothetical protein
MSKPELFMDNLKPDGTPFIERCPYCKKEFNKNLGRHINVCRKFHGDDV